MNTNSDEAMEKSKQQENEIMETLEALRTKNMELASTLAEIRGETLLYQAQYKNLSEELDNINGWLEKIGRTFHELFEDARNALQVSRCSVYEVTVLGSAIEAPEKRKSITRPTVKPGPSGITSRRKVHIERINFRDLQESIENEDNLPTRSPLQPSNSVLQNGLQSADQDDVSTNSVTLQGYQSSENSSLAAAKTVIREVCVRLSRLPGDVVDKHLRKNIENMTSNISSSDMHMASFSASMHPKLTSTPLKLGIMRQLELLPTYNTDFVNTRRKYVPVENKSPATNISPKKEKKTPKSSKRSRSQSNSSRSKKKAKSTSEESTPNVLRSPKVRRAKPQHLKEPALGTKLRREK